MKYRKLDENGDYVFGLNEQGFYSDTEAVAQAILTKIKLLSGEWWEDVNEGTPMFQQVLGAKMTENSKNAIDLILRDRILSVPNVETITAFQSKIDARTRKYVMECNVSTSFGEIEGLTLTM